MIHGMLFDNVSLVCRCHETNTSLEPWIALSIKTNIAQKFDEEKLWQREYKQNFDKQNFDKLTVGLIGGKLREEG